MSSFFVIRLLGIGWFCLIASLCAAQTSVLQSGPWYKVAIEKRGVYKISYDQFKAMGFDLASDPRKIRIYGQGGGMLPQRNSDPRPIDLTENSIFVSGEADGVFDKGDYILFFAEGPDKVHYDIARDIFNYESNLYSDKNFYFVTVSNDPGKRVLLAESIPGSFPVIQHFDDYAYHEADQHNELQSGREWFGERYDLVTSYAYRFDVSGVRQNSSIKIVSDVMAQSFNGSSFKLLFNKGPIGEQVVPIISNTQYSIKGRHKRDTLVVDANTVSAPGNATQEVQYQYVKAGSGKSVGFVDFLLINFSRELALYGNQTIFTSASSLDNAISQYEINGVDQNCTIWDVSNSSEVKNQSFALQSETALFSVHQRRT